MDAESDASSAVESDASAANDADASAASESDASTAVACVRAYGESVLERELGAGLTRLDAAGELSERERAVLAAMATRIVRRVLPRPEAVRASDVDAVTVQELFADDASFRSRDDA